MLHLVCGVPPENTLDLLVGELLVWEVCEDEESLATRRKLAEVDAEGRPERLRRVAPGDAVGRDVPAVAVVVVRLAEVVEQ